MATITSNTYLDGGTSRTPGEAWTNNGGSLIIRTDTRVHANAPASMTGSLGSVTCSSTLGGGLLIDGTKVRELWFSSGIGTVPAIGTTISQGGVSGYLLGVWPNLTSAPITPGNTMPATGFLKFREVTGGAFTSGSLIGIIATATGADVVSWLEIVADQAANFTFVGLGLGKQNIGADYFLGTTNGTAGQTFQAPTNGGGANTHVAGIKVETFPGSNDYMPWPCLADAACGWTTTTVGTDARAKLAQSVGNGVVMIGSDGTTNIGYVPPAGCKVYIPNIFERQCLTTTRAVNELPHATRTTRPEINTTGGGNVNISDTVSDWYYNLNNTATCVINNFYAVDAIVVLNSTTGVLIESVCLGILNSATASTIGLYVVFSIISKLYKCSVAKREFTVGTFYPVLLSACSGVPNGIYDQITCYCALGGIRTTLIYGFTIINSSDFNNLKITLIGGSLFIIPGFNIKDIELDYSDTCKGTTYITVALNSASISNSSNISFKKITFGLDGVITQVNPYNNVVVSSGSNNIKIRGIGSYNALALTTTNPPNYVFTPNTDSNVSIQRVYCNTRSSLVANGSCKNISVESSYTTTNRVLNPVGKLGAIKGSMGGLPAASVSGITGNNINDYFLSSTTGAVVWFGNAPVSENSANVQLTGASAFSGGGSIVMSNLTDTAIFTGAYYIKGHLSFANLAIDLIGTNTANFSIYYQIDINDNNGFNGTWKLASAVNLSAETISPSDGFNLKIKLEVNTASTTNSLAQIKVNTVTSDVAQSTNLYPLDTAKINISGLASGINRIFVYDVTNSVELINTTAATSTFEQYAVYNSDAVLQVRVMQATSTTAKILYETLANFTIDGVVILVSQVNDPIYAANAVDGFSQTGFIIDDSILTISVNKSGSPTLSHVTWQEAYAAETAWLTTAAGIRHFPRVLFASDTANYKLLNGFKIKNTGSYPLIISGGYGVSSNTGLTTDILDYSGGAITTVVDHVVPYQISSSGSGLTTLEHNQLMALPTNSLLTTDTRLNNLDTTISSRMATFTYIAPDNATMTNISERIPTTLIGGKMDSNTTSISNNAITAAAIAATALNDKGNWLTDKTGFSLTSGERTAISTEVQAGILNETDGQLVLNAIVGAIGNSNIDEVALVAAIRSDLERTGGKLINLDSTVSSVLTAVNLRPTNPLLTNDTRLNNLDGSISSLQTSITAIPTTTLTTTEHNALLAIPTTTPDNTTIGAIYNKISPITFTGSDVNSVVTDKTGFSATVTNITAITDNIERTNGLLDNIPTLSEINSSTILAKKVQLDSIETTLATLPLLTDITNGIFSKVIETGETFIQNIRIVSSIIKGTTTGIGTNTENFKSKDKTKIRYSVEFDSNGNRLNTTEDGD